MSAHSCAAMSKTEDATSKKRKLTDADHNESDLPPRKTRNLSSDSPSATPRNVSGAGLTDSVVGDDVKAPKLIEDEKNQKQRAVIPKAYSLPEELHAVKGEETAGLVSRGERKDKAALRQAKSERRSTKARKAGLAGTATDGESEMNVEEAGSGTGEQEQHHNDSGQAHETRSTKLSKQEPSQRFIVFIGNLPYTTTTPAIQLHFAKLQPFVVRHSTDKTTGRSRGFAFLEFESYDRMKTCLKLFHHSLFVAGGGQAPSTAGHGEKRQGRKINVELTAGGGGGKSAARKERIRGKNEKLQGEREKARVHRAKEELAGDRKKTKAGDKTGANAIPMTDADAENENMHPSRRKRMKT